MKPRRDEFLSEEDLDLRNLTDEELSAYWLLWLHQAQATNDLDEYTYEHGVFRCEPSVPGRTQSPDARPAAHDCSPGHTDDAR